MLAPETLNPEPYTTPYRSGILDVILEVRWEGGSLHNLGGGAVEQGRRKLSLRRMCIRMFRDSEYASGVMKKKNKKQKKTRLLHACESRAKGIPAVEALEIHRRVGFQLNGLATLAQSSV